MFLSIIVPCYKEAENIELLYNTITNTLKNEPFTYEIIFINDGSPDNTLEKIKTLSHQNDVKFISFSRNFGKEAAMLAGLKSANGEVSIIMDADLQHPPHYIPTLIKYYHQGYDQVVLKRNRNGEHLFRKLPTQLYYKLINNSVDINLTDGEGDFRLISRKVVDAILSLNEYNRFSKGIFEWVGFNKITLPFENVERIHGKSSFNIFKLIDYAVDGILSFNDKPLRLCFYFGGFTLFISLLYIMITFIQILRYGIDTPGYFTLISSILFLGGVQLFSLGIIGEYIGKIYYETKQRPHFIIDETNIEKNIQKSGNNDEH